MEERYIPLPLKKNTFKNVYIPPAVFQREAGKTGISENPETVKIKAKIFTKELDDLIQKVGSKKKNTSGKDFTIQLVPDTFQYKYSVYQNIFENSGDRVLIEESISKLLRPFGIQKYILMGLEPPGELYSVLFSYNWNEKTTNSLKLHPNNPILKNEFGTQTYSKFLSALENPYLQKFFRNEEIPETQFFLPLKVEFRNLNLVWLFFSDNPISENASEIQTELSPLNPIFYRANESKSLESEMDDPIDEIIRYFKNFYYMNYDEVVVHKVKLENYFNSYDREKKKMEIASLLKPVIGEKEKIYEYTQNTFFIFSKNNYQNKLNEILKSKLGRESEFTIQIFKYPTVINNFYLVL